MMRLLLHLIAFGLTILLLVQAFLIGETNIVGGAVLAALAAVVISIDIHVR